MRYMMFIKHKENFKMEDVPKSLFAAMGEFVEEGMRNGSLIDTAGLQPTEKGKRVRLSGGKITILDGPFAEAKEVVGGYALVEAKSNKEALAVATRFMDLHRIHWPAFEGECEVRPLESMEPQKQRPRWVATSTRSSFKAQAWSLADVVKEEFRIPF